MYVVRHIRALGMAALAAILILTPAMALAAVCDPVGLADMLARPVSWFDTRGLDPRLLPLLSPASWVTGALIGWMLLSDSVVPAIIAAGWFGLRAVLEAMSYFGLGMQSGQTAATPACLPDSPYGMLVNLAFAAAAVLLCLQRRHRGKDNGPR